MVCSAMRFCGFFGSVRSSIGVGRFVAFICRPTIRRLPRSNCRLRQTGVGVAREEGRDARPLESQLVRARPRKQRIP